MFRNLTMLQYLLLMEDLLNFGVCEKYVDKYDYSTDFVLFFLQCIPGTIIKNSNFQV